MIDTLYQGGLQLSSAAWWTQAGWPVVWILLKIVALLAPLMLLVAYLTWWERRLLGFMQVRLGPNRVGPFGLLQPIADALKLLTKELIRPTAANGGLFRLGPIMAIMPALAAWVAVPFGPDVVLANVNAGLLVILAITSIEVYGVIIAGWASNSKYAFLGALRASAQMVSYEIAIGFCFLVVVMTAGSLNLADIVASQARGTGADLAELPVVRPRRGAGQRQRWTARHPGHHVHRGVRRHHRGLGLQLQVRVPRRVACVGADGQL